MKQKDIDKLKDELLFAPVPLDEWLINNKESTMSPKNNKVDKCYQKLKGSKGKGSAAAICQASTKESLKTGKKLKKK